MIDQTQQREMLRPGQGIVPANRPATDFKEFPKMMTHPAYQPGKPGPEIKSPHGFTYHVGGEAIRFPPVLAMNEAQEEYHKSQGYVSQGKSDPAAFARAVGAGQIPNQTAYQPLEYPKWVMGKLCQNSEEEARQLEFMGGSATEMIEKMSEPVTAEIDPPAINVSQAYLDETKEQKIARLKAQLAELGEPVGGGPLQVTEYTERYVKPAPKPKKAAKPVRKAPVLTEEQKNARSAAIKAGLARRREQEAKIDPNPIQEAA